MVDATARGRGREAIGEKQEEREKDYESRRREMESHSLVSQSMHSVQKKKLAAR